MLTLKRKKQMIEVQLHLINNSDDDEEDENLSKKNQEMQKLKSSD